MTDQKKIEAVHAYLRSEFPDSSVADRHDPDRHAHTFELDCNGTALIVIIAYTFFEGQDALDIEKTLKIFLLAEHLLEMADTGVLVTNAGLELP